MSDETTEPAPEASVPEASGTTTADAATPDTEEKNDDKKEDEKLVQTVEMTDVGPCKKHIKVTIERAAIDKRMDEKFKELVGDAEVPGFRPGKAPRKVIVRRFHKDVENEVKGQVLMASLEQLAEEHDVAPLSPPDINPAKLEFPKDGPFVYEFNVEVRPSFDLPDYKGLKLRRPVKTFTDDDVSKEEERVLARFGQLVPKAGWAAKGDFLVADMTSRMDDKVLGSAKDLTLRIDDTMAFKDGVAEKFGEQLAGAKPGDSKVVDITLSDRVAAPVLRGKVIKATFEIKEVKKLKLPELTHEFLHVFGVHNVEQFREKLRGVLESRLEYQQRQSAREQVLQQIAASQSWDLPQDLLQRQARKTLARKVMEMRETGMSEEEIQSRQRLLYQDTLRSTAQALKEQFVLQKIAEEEKIDVDQDDIDAEIERLADQSNESPRRVRAQLEKEDLLDTLAAQVVERKTLDLILDNAEYTDVALEPEKAVSTVEEQAVPGELHDPTAAPPPTEETAEKTES